MIRYDHQKLADAMRLFRVASVAEEVGISRQYLYRLMDGEQPLNTALAERLAVVLGVPVDELQADIQQPSHV